MNVSNYQCRHADLVEPKKETSQVAPNVHGLLLCWHLKNSQPGNRSRLELLMNKFSTKSH
jgi:hypothetical protein